MDSLQYSQHYESGKQAAYDSLAAWQSLGWSSMEMCRRNLIGVITVEFAHAREQVAVTSGHAHEVWEQHIAYFEGYMAALL